MYLYFIQRSKNSYVCEFTFVHFIIWEQAGSAKRNPVISWIQWERGASEMCVTKQEEIIIKNELMLSEWGWNTEGYTVWRKSVERDCSYRANE